MDLNRASTVLTGRIQSAFAEVAKLCEQQRLVHIRLQAKNEEQYKVVASLGQQVCINCFLHKSSSLLNRRIFS